MCNVEDMSGIGLTGVCITRACLECLRRVVYVPYAGCDCRGSGRIHVRQWDVSHVGRVGHEECTSVKRHYGRVEDICGASMYGEMGVTITQDTNNVGACMIQTASGMRAVYQTCAAWGV